MSIYITSHYITYTAFGGNISGEERIEVTSALHSQGDPGEDVPSLSASVFPSTKQWGGGLVGWWCTLMRLWLCCSYCIIYDLDPDFL